MSIDNIIEIYATKGGTIRTYVGNLWDNFKKNWIYAPRMPGKNGKEFTMYKFKTMNDTLDNDSHHHYNLKLANGEMNDDGKFPDDSRIIKRRRWMREYWVDELPQFINVAKGEMKLVGIRPKIKALLNTYSLKEQKQIIDQLPGLAGVQYTDDGDYLTSERKYLESYEKHPILTDIIYAFKISNGIILKGIRSS